MSLNHRCGAFTSGGKAISWAVSNGGHTLVGSISGGATPILTVTIDDAGVYHVTLNGPVDHPVVGQEDTLAMAIGVAVSDGTTTVNSTLTVTVEDDSPVAHNDGPVTVLLDPPGPEGSG